MIEWLAVASGGAIGATLRHGIAQALPMSGDDFPLSTLLVNLLGCAAIGLVTAWFDAKGGHHTMWQVFLMVGVLGGFTTFSTMVADAAVLGDKGAMLSSLTYVALTIIGGFSAFILLRFAGATWLNT